MKNKRAKRVLLALGALVLAVALSALVYVWPMFAMEGTPTGPVGATGVLAANAGSNSVYLLECENGYIAVDAGSSGKKLQEALGELGVDSSDILYVLLTHTDSDHVGGYKLFPNAHTYISADEMQMIDGTTKRNAFAYNQAPLYEGRYTTVEDGEKIELGGRAVRCIATPGHTSGSMSFMVDGMLFTGDALAVKGGEPAPHPYTMDDATARLSMEKLQSRVHPQSHVFTAHYGVYRADALFSEELTEVSCDTGDD